jgi:hypothetical protein
LYGLSNGWTNHPAILMWKGYEEALKKYYNVTLAEWVERGYINNMPFLKVYTIIYPPWLGKDKFHSSHRSALLFKNFEFYSQYRWKEKPIINYYWPVRV